MFQTIKKNGLKILFDLLNINNHNLKDALLKGHMNQKKNVPPP
jgi:hypothetical protein